MEVVARDAVVFAQVSLGLVPEILDAVDVVAVAGNEGLLMIDAMVVKTGDIKDVVRPEGIRVDDRIRLYFGLYDRQQRYPADVGNHLGVDATTSFEDPEHGHLAARAAATFALAHAAEIALVNLDLAVDRTFILDARCDDLAQSVIKQRGGVLVDADQFRRRAGRSSGDKMLAQPSSLFFREFGTP